MKTLAEVLTLGLALAKERGVKYCVGYGNRQGMCILLAHLHSENLIDSEERETAYQFLDKMMNDLWFRHRINFIYLCNYLMFTGVTHHEMETVWVNHYQAIIDKLNQGETV